MNQKKKMAAALTAVAAYIKSEQEIQMAMAWAAEPAPVLPEVQSVGNAWALNGRQTQMQMRSLLQMKAFHGAKLR